MITPESAGTTAYTAQHPPAAHVETYGIEHIPESERYGKPRDMLFVWACRQCELPVGRPRRLPRSAGPRSVAEPRRHRGGQPLLGVQRHPRHFRPGVRHPVQRADARDLRHPRQPGRFAGHELVGVRRVCGGQSRLGVAGRVRAARLPRHDGHDHGRGSRGRRTRLHDLARQRLRPRPHLAPQPAVHRHADGHAGAAGKLRRRARRTRSCPRRGTTRRRPRGRTTDRFRDHRVRPAVVGKRRRLRPLPARRRVPASRGMVDDAGRLRTDRPAQPRGRTHAALPST